MSDIRQFLPSLYILLVMGMSGFALAAQSAGLWVLSVGAILLNAWLVRTGRFRALPRLLANAITIVAMLWVFMTLSEWTTPPIIVIGQFLVLLQLVKLYEQRGNRDFAQLLVLSLLLMVAAAISTATLAFGALFIAYLFLSLYCCLLFHLKVETDHAKAVIGLSEDKLNPLTLRQDQRYLPRSMRRLTVVVSLSAVTMAVLVFLFFPRSTGGGLLGPLNFRPQTMTGFSDRMSFQTVAQITQNAEVVAHVKLWQGAGRVEGTQPLLLRGVTLDVYSGNSPRSVPWQWSRAGGGSEMSFSVEPNRTIELREVEEPLLWRQEVVLLPTGTDVLFAVAGAAQFRPQTMEVRDLRFAVSDRSIRTEPPINGRTTYEVQSTGRIIDAPPPRADGAQATRPPDEGAAEPVNPPAPDRASEPARTVALALPGLSPAGDGAAPERSIIDAQIEEYARRPEVSGEDPSGPLAARRPREHITHELDIPIAQAIDRHLRGDAFSYTLDLTDASRIGEGRDPVVAFLYDLKRGHCEYFAGAMTLMCQSLGLKARVVIGFKCEEYNQLTHTYVVRQSHAHAWVEVMDTDGEWVAFDPTSGRGAQTSRSSGLWARVKQFFDFLEYSWASSVVAYDRESRDNLIQNVESRLNTSATSSADRLKKARSWFDFRTNEEKYWLFSSRIITFLIVASVMALLAAVGWFIYERWKLRRRVKRIGLGALPHDDQLRLARQLGFYDALLRLLARHRIICPPHLTPMEFSETVSFLPAEIFNAVRRLTDIFYRIRYGGAELSAVQQRRLRSVIGRIEQGLEGLT
jgi:transglutaminase-like putative cysteine protease